LTVNLEYMAAHKIAINIEGEEILFEPDEERNYRAVIPDYEGSKIKIGIGLIQAIVSSSFILSKGFQWNMFLLAH
jgi:hypothetical protein